jgi:hypothetical protein
MTWIFYPSAVFLKQFKKFDSQTKNRVNSEKLLVH